MHKFLMAIAAMLIAFAPQQALAGQQDFVVVNHTGYDIREVYVSPSSSPNWEEDVLDWDLLENGDRVTIRFDRDEDACLWDIKVVYTDDSEVEWGALNLCEISVVVLNYNDSTGETWATTE